MSGAFSFEGERVPFESGQTVGAALIATGRVSWRTTRIEGRPRGMFCGIGVCFDCLVTIDGASGQRACLAAAVDGAQVTAHDEGGAS